MILPPLTAIDEQTALRDYRGSFKGPDRVKDAFIPGAGKSKAEATGGF
jgi:hypothetical protein